MHFWLHNFTRQTCSVAPFSASYEPLPDVPITMCLTAYTDEYRRTWILVFNEVLWLGSSMDHSLVKSNRISTTGIPVSDFPFNSTLQLGIHHKLAFITFQTDGTEIYFETHVPKMEERLECTWLVISGDT